MKRASKNYAHVRIGQLRLLERCQAASTHCSDYKLGILSKSRANRDQVLVMITDAAA